jgi:hypothetical protein
VFECRLAILQYDCQIAWDEKVFRSCQVDVKQREEGIFTIDQRILKGSQDSGQTFSGMSQLSLWWAS